MAVSMETNAPWRATPAVAMASGRAVRLKIGLRSEIADLIERYYGSGRSAMGTIVENLSDESGGDEDDVEHLRDLASEAPVSLLAFALLGLVSLAEFLPVMFLSPLAGVMADRRDRVGIIRITQLIGCAQATTLAVLVATDAIGGPWVCPAWPFPGLLATSLPGEAD